MKLPLIGLVKGMSKNFINLNWQKKKNPSTGFTFRQSSANTSYSRIPKAAIGSDVKMTLEYYIPIVVGSLAWERCICVKEEESEAKGNVLVKKVAYLSNNKGLCHYI